MLNVIPKLVCRSKTDSRFSLNNKSVNYSRVKLRGKRLTFLEFNEFLE